MRIGLIQMQCEKAATTHNLVQIAEILDDLAGYSPDVVAFPEMSLTGYTDPVRHPEVKLELDGPELRSLLDVTRPHGFVVMVGLIERNPAGKPWITQVVMRAGELLGSYRKITIKGDEAIWFGPGKHVFTFPLADRRIGVAICADIDNEQVFADCAREGASIVFEMAAPGLYGDQKTRNWESGYHWWEGECHSKLGAYARRQSIWIAVSTQAGRTMDEDFPGGAWVFTPTGERVFATIDGKPGWVCLELDTENGTAALLAQHSANSYSETKATKLT